MLVVAAAAYMVPRFVYYHQLTLPMAHSFRRPALAARQLIHSLQVTVLQKRLVEAAGCLIATPERALSAAAAGCTRAAPPSRLEQRPNVKFDTVGVLVIMKKFVYT